jgi:hypothetical protein
MKITNVAGWVIILFGAASIILPMAYADVRDRRDRRGILREGESAIGTILAVEAENGKYPAWRVTVEFQAINQTEPTRIQFQIRASARPQSWAIGRRFGVLLVNSMILKLGDRYHCTIQSNGQGLLCLMRDHTPSE